MEYQKNFDLGKKQILISLDSKLKLRIATDREKHNYFSSQYCECPLFNIDVWENIFNKLFVCTNIVNKVINTYEQYSLWEKKQEDYWNLSRRTPDFIKWKLLENGKLIVTLKNGAIRGRGYFDKKELIDINYNFFYPFDFLEIFRKILIELNYKKEGLFKKRFNHTKEESDLYNHITDTAISAHVDELNSYRLSMDAMKKSSDYLLFMNQDIHVLNLNDELFFDGLCGFDIYSKEKELSEYLNDIKEKNKIESDLLSEKAWQEKVQQKNLLRKQENEQADLLRKQKSSDNSGEKSVDYAIKWFMASTNDSIIAIMPDCESNYRYNCIYLCNPDFLKEAQEYDHILISPYGVICIETKHWSGRVEIRKDGKWVRETAEEKMMGIENPGFQIKRHELLLNSILPNVPVFSLLCFSNSSAIIEGQEYFNDYPIVYADQLGNYLNSIKTEKILSENQIKDIANTIEKHKINKM